MINIEQMEKTDTACLILAYVCLGLFAASLYFEAHGLLVIITLMATILSCGFGVVHLSKTRRCRILSNIGGEDVKP